jgi:ABC-2 type transport system ATP-binding protein
MSSFAIEVVGLRKQFDAVVAVDGLDLRVPAGECVGLLGPNGAGKTTTVEILEGLQEKTSGQVTVLGRRWEDDAGAIRERIGVQLQETRFYERLTVEETVRLFRSFYRNGLAVEAAVAQVRLEEKRDAQVMKLSGGQRQRLALAVALVADPELLFLDEPTTGLDPQSRRALWEVIEDLKKKRRTVVLTTHYMEEAERLCDRIVIVDRGRIIAEGTPAQLIGRHGGNHWVELTPDRPLDEASLRQVANVDTVVPQSGGYRLAVRELHRALPELLAAIERQGAKLEQLSTAKPTLDDVFLNLTGHRLREDADE